MNKCLKIVCTCAVPTASGQCVSTGSHEAVVLLVKGVVVWIPRNYTILKT